MKKISKAEIDFEKGIYDQHFRNIESGWDYMRKNGYAHGGWQMLAKQAVIIRNISAYLDEIAKVLNIDLQKVDESLNHKQKIGGCCFNRGQDLAKNENVKDILFPSFTPLFQEQMIPLKDACFELSNEGYDITFDSYNIRQYLNRHPECFEGCWKTEKNLARKNKKYFVKKEKLLELLSKFPYQTSSQRKIINHFIKWRLIKNQEKNS